MVATGFLGISLKFSDFPSRFLKVKVFMFISSIRKNHLNSIKNIENILPNSTFNNFYVKKYHNAKYSNFFCDRLLVPNQNIIIFSVKNVYKSFW